MSVSASFNLCQFTRTTDGARCPRKSTRMGPFCKAHAYYIKRKAERATLVPTLVYNSEISSPDEMTMYSPSTPPQEFSSPSSSTSGSGIYSFNQQSFKVSSGSSTFLAQLESSAMNTLVNLNSPRFAAMEAPNHQFISYSTSVFGTSTAGGFLDTKSSSPSSDNSMLMDSLSSSSSSSSSTTYHVCEWMQEVAGGSIQCGLPVWNGGPFCHDHLMYQNQETLQAAEFLASLRSQIN